MRINKNENPLKKQHIHPSADGNALGLRASREIVRATMFIKDNWLFRTKKMSLCFQKKLYRNSVRRGLFVLFIELSRTVFLLHPLPRVTFRFVPPSILPWAKIYLPFRP